MKRKDEKKKTERKDFVTSTSKVKSISNCLSLLLLIYFILRFPGQIGETKEENKDQVTNQIPLFLDVV